MNDTSFPEVPAMWSKRVCPWFFGLFLLGTAVSVDAASYRLAEATVVTAKDSPAMVRLAADEVRAYVYRLTGSWPALAESVAAGKPAIMLRSGPGGKVPPGGPDPSQNFVLYAEGSRQIVHGASERATLWAAYQLIESWSIGFYLGGDAVPPIDANKTVDLIEHAGVPVFKIRGNLPWFNFLNSPTTWNPQDYKTFFTQMAKQKANLINFHAYDHEPFCGYDIKHEPFSGSTLVPTETVMGGPLMTTISEFRWWSPHQMTTKDHLFGTGLFFDRGEWGCEVGIEDAWTFAPGRAVRLQQKMMADALAYARALGIETCLGFEVSGDALDQTNEEGLRKRISHVLKTYPLDYLGIWQAEHLGLRGATVLRKDDKAPDADELWNAFSYFPAPRHQSEGVRMARLIRLAYQVMQGVAPNVKMVVSGWGGDQHMKFTDYYIGLDKVVPGDVIFAALDNIDPRSADLVSEAYSKLSPGRVRWPIPWFESDAGHTRIDQTGPQTNVTAFEPLLKDIADKNCEGALGIHWRTRNVEDVAGYLYRFGWNKDLTAADFFRQYARDQYGPADAEHMAAVHLKLEEFGPQYVGARGTVECGTKSFNWFNRRDDSPIVNHGPNLSGNMPVPNRFPELEAMASDLLARSRQAATDDRGHAANQYHDLAMTIHWLVTRAKVGLAIWGEKAPLERRLREAEQKLDEGNVAAARELAGFVLSDLEKLDFRSALQALASTCRTRGELGMLTTANARYGRYYATFVQRIAHIMAQPLPGSRGLGEWDGPPVTILYPVPNHVAAGTPVNFDAVLHPALANPVFRIVLSKLEGPGEAETTLQLERLGGAYYRAVFFPPGRGVWAWRLVPVASFKQAVAEQGVLIAE
ncbi:MAG TPA: hypothetical protein VLM89_06600 [Phycisphaerae bacterium]|nr:hypothetical protein [Phycisphaerae bacterium]